MMTLHMQRELDKLKRMILELAAVAEESVQQAVDSLERIDTVLAEEVIRNDDQIDQREVDLEEECLKILALYQPVAADLRFIVSVLKINNDLERISDLAVNIAERTLGVAKEGRVAVPFDFAGMGEKVLVMLNRALDALVNRDIAAAREVCLLDDEVDAIHKRNYGLVKEQIKQHPERIDTLIQYTSVSRHLERIADLATNIAEDIIYMIEGEIIRHTY